MQPEVYHTIAIRRGLRSTPVLSTALWDGLHFTEIVICDHVCVCVYLRSWKMSQQTMDLNGFLKAAKNFIKFETAFGMEAIIK